MTQPNTNKLSHFLKEETALVLASTGAFFAHSEDQLKALSKPGVTYVDLGAALVSPKDKAEKVIEAFDGIRGRAMLRDIETNGLDTIIRREQEYFNSEPDMEQWELDSLLNEYALIATPSK